MLSNDLKYYINQRTCSFDRIKKSFVHKYFEGANLMNENDVEFLFSFALILYESISTYKLSSTHARTHTHSVLREDSRCLIH